MAKLFIDGNGRLKSGRISLLVFGLLLLAGMLLFNLQKPVDEAVVLVRHVFEAPAPKSAAPPPAAPEKKPPLNDKAVAGSAAESASVSPDEPEEERTTVSDTPPADKNRQILAAADAGERPEEPAAALPALAEKVISETEESSPDHPDPPAPAAVAPVAALSEPVSSTAAEAVTNSPTALPTAQGSEPEAGPEAKPAENLISEENVRPDPVAEWTTGGRSASAPLLNAAALKQLQAIVKENEAKKVSPVNRLPEIKLAKSELIPRPSPEAAVRTKPMAEKTSPVGKNDCDHLLVAREDYKRLHNDWRRLGGEGMDPPSQIGLQIENLRQAYRYFQMKAVVLLADGRCFDLSDGSCLPEAALKRYSQTVIKVTDPWSKWAPELSRLGLNRDSSLIVRYYMLPFIKKALYARAYQAYRAQSGKGRLTQVSGPEEVDILGRAYVIEQQGGGAFGIFLPHTLHLADGSRQRLDSEIFAADSDVKSLRRAGVLGRHS